MSAAAIANETKSNIGPDYSLAFELADAEEAEEVDETAERQRVNLAMAEWWGV